MDESGVGGWRQAGGCDVGDEIGEGGESWSVEVVGWTDERGEVVE